MLREKSNIVLVGMPGAGKSTVGVLLAKHCARSFVDTDLLIQNAEGTTLQHIVDTRGFMVLREIEARILLDLQVENAVIATGGSAVYSEPAMAHLKQTGTVVYLRCDQTVIEQRIGNAATRGLAKRPEQTLSELFRERSQLYERCADITVDASRGSADLVCEAIVQALSVEEDVPPGERK